MNAIPFVTTTIVIAAVLSLASLQPLLFVIATLTLCTILFATHQFDALEKERSLYTDSPIRNHHRFFLYFQAYFESIIFSAMAGLLPVILLNGSYSARTINSSFVFAFTIILFTVVLFQLRRSFSIRPIQWGLLRLSLPAGILYSILDSIFVKPKSLSDALPKDWKNVLHDLWDRDLAESLDRRIKEMNPDELIELFHAFLEFADTIVYKVLLDMFSETIATILHIFLTLDLTFGVPICAFSVLIVQASDKTKRFTEQDSMRG